MRDSRTRERRSSSTEVRRALPMAIPASIEVDVTALELGDSIRVEELSAIEGVEFLDDPDTVIATVAIPRAVVEEEPEEGLEGEEGAEGDEGAEEGAADEAAEEDSGE